MSGCNQNVNKSPKYKYLTLPLCSFTIPDKYEIEPGKDCFACGFILLKRKSQIEYSFGAMHIAHYSSRPLLKQKRYKQYLIYIIDSVSNQKYGADLRIYDTLHECKIFPGEYFSIYMRAICSNKELKNEALSIFNSVKFDAKGDGMDRIPIEMR